MLQQSDLQKQAFNSHLRPRLLYGEREKSIERMAKAQLKLEAFWLKPVDSTTHQEATETQLGLSTNNGLTRFFWHLMIYLCFLESSLEKSPAHSILVLLWDLISKMI